MAEALYRAASDASTANSETTGPDGAETGAGGATGGGKDDVIDAEYTEGPK